MPDGGPETGANRDRGEDDQCRHQQGCFGSRQNQLVSLAESGVPRVLQRVRHGSVAHQSNGHPSYGKQWNADSHDRKRDQRKPRAFPQH